MHIFVCAHMYMYVRIGCPPAWHGCVCIVVESAAAVQHVLRCLGFDGSDSKSISDSFLLELQPDELQWTKVSGVCVCVCVCVCVYACVCACVRACVCICHSHMI